LHCIVQDGIGEGMIALVKTRHAAEVMLGQYLEDGDDEKIGTASEHVGRGVVMMRRVYRDHDGDAI
jgi:hypothetical protein